MGITRINVDLLSVAARRINFHYLFYKYGFWYVVCKILTILFNYVNVLKILLLTNIGDCHRYIMVIRMDSILFHWGWENGCHFADDIFKCFSIMKMFVFWLKFHWCIPESPVNNILALDKVMAWWQPIIWTNDNLVNWCTYISRIFLSCISLSLNELIML